MQSFNRVRYDKTTLNNLTQNLERIKEANYKYSFWINVYKMLLNEEITSEEYLGFV